MIRRMAMLCAILVLCMMLSSCVSKPKPGTTANAKFEIGESSVFTESEIRAAMDSVLTKFADFEGCDLTRLWYGEKRSDDFFYRNGGVNQIMLLSDFTTDSTHGYWNSNSGFKSDSAYTDWQWSLTRDNPESNWKVKDWGYG